ncbi:MAG: PAS domain-containing protein, partial [Actinomycetota bacterium]
MVVEGDEALRSMIASVLERHGYRVAAVVLGEAAAVEAARIAPELVVLGVRLPDLDGVEVCRGLRALEGLGEVPVVFVGPADDAEARARVFDEEMTDYLAQPFSEGELRTRVETQLGVCRLRRWLRQRGLELESLAARATVHVASGGTALEHAAAQLSALLGTLPDLVCFKDAQGRYLGCNAPVERLLGRRRQDIVGRTDAELHDADVAAALERADGQAIAAGRPCTRQEWVRDREGNDVLVEAVTSPVHSADGQLLGVLSVARDITQVEADRRRLARSQADLADSQAAAGVGSWRMDLRTGQLDWSAETRRLYGVDPEVAPSVELATSLLHPEDRDAVLAAWEAALEEGRGEIEHRLLVDGQTRWVHARWEVEYDGHGDPAGAVGTMLDVTERKTAERRLAAEQARLHDAVEAAQAATWQWQWQDPAGEVVVDDRWERLLGYGPGELGRLSSMAWAELVHPDDTAAVRRAWAQLLAGTRGRYEAEYRLRHRDGRWVWFRDLGRVLERGETGQPVHVWGLALDISASKAQQELVDFVAQHDELTGLFNRERFTHQLRDELLAAEEAGSSLTLVCLDLDALAALNEVHGRTAGNEALVAVADRLLDLVDDHRCVGRIDGDEFAVVLRDDAPRPEVEQRLEALRAL